MSNNPVEIINTPEAVLKQIAGEFLVEYSWIAWIIVALVVLKWILGFFPHFDVLMFRVFTPLANSWKFKALQRKVVQWDIEGNVNEFVKETQRELPKGWSIPVKIKWVKEESPEKFIEQNEVVIRMRPVQEQDWNFVVATHHFFEKTFFPRTKRAIPQRAQIATSLQITRRLIQSKKPEYEESFQDHVLEPAIQKDKKLLDFLDRLERIDKKGFFTSSYVREIHEIANEAMYNELRKRIPDESAEVLNHIEEFTEHINKKGMIPERTWTKLGPISSYGFLLVANPNKTQAGTGQYVNRAKTQLTSGARRLYVFGAEPERNFVKKVIQDINKEVNEYVLIETFDLHADYRGKRGGIGAFFIEKS